MQHKINLFAPKETMQENSHRYFRNDKCCYFPCHEGISSEDFNCLFCYCPLNSIVNCGGNYSITHNGKKDCSKCCYPHYSENYDHIIEKVSRLLDKLNFPDNGITI